jgi:dTDP-4-amino-4,6-dideoxygalactose transaminase
MKIKFVDLAAQNREIRAEVERDSALIHQKTAYVGGEAVSRFEQEFARYLGVKHAVGVANGTDALRLALAALGVGPGAEVVTVPMTFVATVEAIVQLGARPVFVDVDPVTATMSVPALRACLKSAVATPQRRVKAVLPVHLYGRPAAMEEIISAAAPYDIPVVEDACQAHGARLLTKGGWARAGSLGLAGCFSFYPAKNLGGWGDGGAISTNDSALAERLLLLRDHGRSSHYEHALLGSNSRLDALQAAVLRAKLGRLDRWNARRRAIAACYRELLDDLALAPPDDGAEAESCYHLFTVRSRRRDAIRAALLHAGIECGVHYPLPLHLQPACRFLKHRPGDFPVSELVARTTLSLPMHPHLTNLEAVHVAEVVREAVGEGQDTFTGEPPSDEQARFPVRAGRRG